MAMLFIDIFDPDSYKVMRDAIDAQHRGHPCVEVIPFCNGSVYSYLPLLAFAWMKFIALGEDCFLLLKILDCVDGRAQYHMEDIMTCITSIDGTIDCDLSPDFVGIDNVDYLASLFRRSDMLGAKVMTLVTASGDIYMGYNAIRLHFCSVEDGYSMCCAN